MKFRPIDELFLFFPSKFPDGDWNPAQLKREEVFFRAKDRTKCHAWYCPAVAPRAVVLIAQGNAGNIAHRASWLRYLQQQMRLSVFMFDYRGYGKSEGKPSVDGIIQDARAARAKLCELTSLEDENIVLMGESLGAAILVQLASESAPKGLILQSAFSSLRDVADVHFPKLSSAVSKKKLNSATLIANYLGPLLQSHGTMDRTIPIESGRKLFSAAKGAKRFVEIINADHNDWITDNYLTELDKFIAEIST